MSNTKSTDPLTGKPVVTEEMEFQVQFNCTVKTTECITPLGITAKAQSEYENWLAGGGLHELIQGANEVGEYVYWFGMNGYNTVDGGYVVQYYASDDPEDFKFVYYRIDLIDVTSKLV